MTRNSLLSSRQIEGHIADGQIIVIYNDNVLRLDSWLHEHPGGQLAILHMVGRDATDEINAYHLLKTQRLMQAYRIGKIQQPWINLVPPLHGGIYRKYGWDNLGTGVLEDNGSDWSSEKAVCWSSSASATSTAATSTTNKHNTLKQPVERKAAFGIQEAPALLSEDIKIPECVNKEEKLIIVEKWKCDLPRVNLSKAAYTAMLEQKEVHQATRAYPSLDLETQQSISREYRALHERIKNEGFYNCRYSEYGKEAIRWVILFGIFIFFLNARWYLTSAVFLGMFWQQIMFAAHDAGHRGITGDFIVDTLIGAFIADFCCGLSIGWWKSSHNVHHLVTNMPEHDPDLQNIPLFATSPSYLKNIMSTFYNFSFVWNPATDFPVQFQKWTYYPVMALARFNLYFLSWLHLMSPRAQNLGSAGWTRPVEIAMMVCYWIWFGYGLVWLTLPNWPIRIGFVLISHGITMLLHVQITLSHWGMPTSSLGPMESFAQHQLRSTMDIECPVWLDFLHGGLQFQAIHHLFPRVPRHNLRALQVMVREFCAKTQIEYKCHGFVEGNKIILSRLEEVAKMAETLMQCQSHMAETGQSGLH